MGVNRVKSKLDSEDITSYTNINQLMKMGLTMSSI